MLMLFDYPAIIQTAIDRWGQPIGEGRHRMVFRESDGWVVKVPKTDSGLAACYEEIVTQGQMFARTERHPWSDELGFDICRMEFVVHAGYSARPDWTWSVDSGQVGYTQDGRLVAYDWEHL